MRKKTIICFLTLAVILFGIPFSIYRLFFYYPDISIRVEDLYNKNRVVQVDNEYFTLTNGNICNVSEKKIIYSTTDKNAFIKSQCDLLWIYDKDSKENLKAFDSAGNIVKSYSVYYKITDFFISGDMIFCTAKDPNRIKLYKISDDDTLKLIPIKYTLVYEDSNSYLKLYKYNCEYGECLQINNDTYYAYDNNYNNIISSETTNVDLLCVEKDGLIYTDDQYHMRRYSVFSYLNKTKMENAIKMNNTVDSFFLNKLFYTDNDIVISVAQNTTIRSISRHPPVNLTDEMEHHYNDVLFIFNKDDFSSPIEYNTKTFERIIYADNEKAITYYNGKYITYSLENWKKINKQNADEIKEGGSYTYDVCEEYIFVFDENTGEMINKITIE